jgi:hypothetical protein
MPVVVAIEACPDRRDELSKDDAVELHQKDDTVELRQLDALLGSSKLSPFRSPSAFPQVSTAFEPPCLQAKARESIWSTAPHGSTNDSS